VTNEDSPAEGADTSKLEQANSAIGIVARLHGRARRVIGIVLVVGTVAGVLEAVALVLFMNAALRVTSDTKRELNLGPVSIDASPLTLLAAAALATVAASAVHALLARVTADATVDVLRNTRSSVLGAYLKARWRTQSEVPDGVIQDSALNLSQTAASLARAAMAALNGAIILVALIAGAFIVSPGMTLALTLSLVPIAIVLRPLAQFARWRAHRAVDEVRNFSQEVASTGSMAMEIQAFGVTDQQLARLDEMNRVAAEATRGVQFSMRLSAFWFKDLALLMLIVVVGVIHLVSDLSAGSSSAAIIVVIRALGYAQQSYNAYTNVVEFAPGIIELNDRTQGLLDQGAPTGGRKLDSIGVVRLDHVGYRYPNGHDALVDVSLELPHGTVIGLVGPSGAGKSTLAEILLRLREPTSGSVSVDGVELSHTRIEDWRRLVAYVPQEPRLWQRTVADNISFMRTQFTRDDVVSAARAAHLDAEILMLPEGYDTMLGTQSRGLSGGQRQRLAIARALISDPAMIVLDEPTSALDPHSEQLLQRTLAELRGHVTMVVIAHRTSTLDICDELVLVQDGRVAAAGPREELMRSHEFFDRLAETDLDHGSPAGDPTSDAPDL
jgi:ABC-type multidrug transport system fused ATPase/permease subunit